MDSSPPGSSVHGILQARVPEWDAICYSLLIEICAFYRWSPLELSKLFGRGHKLVSKSYTVEDHITETILSRTNRSHFLSEQLGFGKSDRRWKKSLPTGAEVSFFLLMTCKQLLSENTGVQLICWSLHFCRYCWIVLSVKLEVAAQEGRTELNCSVNGILLNTTSPER